MWKKRETTSGQLRILVAEDNPHDQLLFGLAVEGGALDAAVTFVDDGVAVVEHLDHLLDRRTLPDIVVLDLQMPRMDGHSVLTKIRANSAFDDLAVVVFSSSVHPAEVQRSLDRGALAHVTKPSTFEELEAFVASLNDRATLSC